MPSAIPALPAASDQPARAMPEAGPSLLFVPASGPAGSGEYYRCLALARAMVERRPGLEMAFLLHERAAVEHDDRFDYRLIRKTPSCAGTAVSALIEALRPDLTVFDNSGRVFQMAAARVTGSRVVWVSNRQRKRLKGFRPRQMRCQDLHLVIDDDPARRLAWHERLLSSFYPDMQVELTGPVTPRTDPAALAPWGSSLPAAGTFALFVPGGGGYRYRGRAVPEIFHQAAVRFQRETGAQAVVVPGPQYAGTLRKRPGVELIEALPTTALGALLDQAGLAVVGGGSMLAAQAVLAGKPMVMAPCGGRDQPARIKRMVAAGMALKGRLDAVQLADAAARLWREPVLASRMREQLAALSNFTGTEQVVGHLLALLDAENQAPSAEKQI